jgi:glutathione S-transferase
MTILDDALEGHACVVGDQLSLADIPVGALMYRYANLDVTAALPPNVARWYACLTEREAFQAHVMLPFDDLKGRLAP